MQHNKVMGHWWLTARGPSSVAAPPGALVL